MSRTPQNQVTHFISDLYSMELQALAQLETAPDLAGDPGLAADFRQHFAETEQQASLVRNRMEALGESPSRVKDAVMKLGGKGFLLFAKAQTETPGRLLAHAYAYEAMEWAGYAVLLRMAQITGDAETASLAKSIQTEERKMMKRLEGRFDGAERASHSDTPAEDMDDHVSKHLAEAHALLAQSIELLGKGADKSGDPELDTLYSMHLSRTRTLQLLTEQRLQALGAKPSAFQDAAMKLGGLNWNLFFQAQADYPTKLMAFIYAVGHLKIAGYELLRRVARRARDIETEQLCFALIEEERAMAAELESALNIAVLATFETVQA